MNLNKSDENQLIKYIFNLPNRNRIIEYGDFKLLTYVLGKCKKYENIETLISNISKEHLITHSSYIISKLNWSEEKAREFLNNKFNVNSRNKLEVKGLLKFNSLLEKVAN